MISKNDMKFTFPYVRVFWELSYIYLCIVDGLSHFTTTELGSCNRDLMTFEKIYYLAFYRKKMALISAQEVGE